jgi:hypothetical protein
MVDAGEVLNFNLGVLLCVTGYLGLGFRYIHSYASCKLGASLSFGCLSMVSGFRHDSWQLVVQNDCGVYLVCSR